MEIEYDGIVSESGRYKYAVKQNNKSNIIIFKFKKQQEGIILDPNKHFYVKVRNSGKTFTDKDPNVVITSTETDILVSWTMLRKATQFKNIDIQLQYEDTENDIIWQSAIVNLDLFDTIPADKEIEDKYPSILMKLKQQIDEQRIEILEEQTARQEADELLDINKQDKLISGSNIKTINGQPILGSGNLEIARFDINIENGSGTSAVQQKQDGTSGTFDFTGKNPNATALDPTLTGNLTYGAVGDFSSSFGGKGQASGKRSFQVGTTTVAKGNYSFASGDNSVALGNDSSANNYQTVAAGTASFSTGYSTQVTGTAGFVSGTRNKVDGGSAAAFGSDNNADHNNQFVIGLYNDNKVGTLFEVGNGTDNQYRSNAFEVFQGGYATVQNTDSNINECIVNVSYLNSRNYQDAEEVLSISRSVVEDRQLPLTIGPEDTGRNINTVYDYSFVEVKGGVNTPDAGHAGVLLTLPYRKPSGNNKPDFGAQLYITNGDDPNGKLMYYRTAMADEWDPWEIVATRQYVDSNIPSLTNYITKTDYATNSVGGVIKTYSSYCFEVTNAGIPYCPTKTYEQYQSSNNNTFIGKGTLENVLEGKGFVYSSDLDNYVKTTDYATTTKAGIIRASATYGTQVSGQFLQGRTRTYEQYQADSGTLFVCKGTLENILEGKGIRSTITLTQAEFDALTEYADNTDYQII